ncbi:MAG: hypothetical protein U0547_00030 [Dehalococcoidia bacterium]
MNATVTFEQEFADWLAGLGEAGQGRRLVRRGSREILVSKLEPDVLARVQQTMLGLIDLLSPEALRERYTAIAAREPGILRVTAWRLAIRELLAGTDLSPAARNEAEAGTDSVAALLDTVLWSAPVANVPFTLSEGERQAYDDARERMGGDAPIFTRYYGDFAGLPVMNHCPGAPIARKLLAEGWALCTE